MSAREIIDHYLSRYEKEYENKISNSFDYTRGGIDAISHDLSKLRKEKKQLEDIRLNCAITAGGFAFATLILSWFLGMNLIVFIFILIDLMVFSVSGICHLKFKNLEQEYDNLETIRSNLQSKKSNDKSFEMTINKLKQKIDNLKNTKIFFQKNHRNEILDILELSGFELSKILENNMSLLSFLYLKYKRLISDSAIEKMSYEDLKKLRIAKGDNIEISLLNDPSLFFKEDGEKENENEYNESEKNVGLVKTVSVTNMNLVGNEYVAPRRRRFKEHSDFEHEANNINVSSRRR